MKLHKSILQFSDEEDRQDETLDYETDPEDKEAEHSTINDDHFNVDDQDRSDVESVHNSSQKMVNPRIN